MKLPISRSSERRRGNWESNDFGPVVRPEKHFSASFWISSPRSKIKNLKSKKAGREGENCELRAYREEFAGRGLRQ
jgi:hypothetical protein